MASSIRARKLVDHPFYPRDLSLPLYRSNALSGNVLLGGFAAVCAVLATLAFVASGVSKHADGISCKRMSFVQRLLFTWCVLSGAIHIVLEGYFVVNASTLVSLQTPLGQLWKEYALADSRYLWGESGVWIIEAITSFIWGPLLFLVAYRIFNNAHRLHSYLAWLLMISTGQLYGTIVYFYTSIKVHAVSKNHAVQSTTLASVLNFIGRLYTDDTVPHPYYFWFYYVFMNAIWIVIPTLCTFYALCTLGRDPAVAVEAQRKQEQQIKQSTLQNNKKKHM